MMRTLFIILLSITTFSMHAQQVNLLSVDDLEQRMANGKDTTYVVNFWATWCAPCVAELPNFEKLRVANLDKPVKILLVSLDFKSKLQKTVIPFVLANRIHASVYLFNTADRQTDIQKINKQWSGSIPATWFVNKQGRKFYEKEFSEDGLKDALQQMRAGSN